MKQILCTESAPAAIGPYSQGVAAGSGQIIAVSGQLPIDCETGSFAGEDISSQTKQSLLNIQAILESHGCTLADVIKTTVFLKDLSEFAQMNEVYSSFFAEGPPARSTIEVAKLPRDAKVEIEALAVK